MDIQTINKNLRLILIHLIFLIFILLFLTNHTSTSFAKSKTTSVIKPTFKKEISKISVGKTFTYKVKGINKTAKIYYASNHTSIATINKHSGLLRAKKRGVTTITATIKNKTKIYKLRTTLKVIDPLPKPKILQDTYLTISKIIHPRNRTIEINSSRILLQSEVKNTSLTLKNSNKPSLSLSANFKNLSANGKKAVYEIPATSFKKICPGNRTLDGKYLVSSSLFSGTKSILYKERLSASFCCGFVLTKEAAPLEKATVTVLTQDSKETVYSTDTDKMGYFEIPKKISGSYIIQVSKSGYEPFSLSSISLNSPCIDNIILTSNQDTEHAVTCIVSDANDNRICDAEIALFHSSKKLLLSGFTDKNGMFSFTDAKTASSFTNYTSVSITNSTYKPEFFQNTLPTATNIHSLFSKNIQLSNTDEYILQIKPNDQSDSHLSSYNDCTIAFSFPFFLSNHLSISLSLSETKAMKTDSITLPIDISNLTKEPVSVQYTLICNHGKELFPSRETAINRQSFDSQSTNLSFSISLPDHIHLKDDSYYLQCIYFDQNQKICGTSTDIVQVKEQQLEVEEEVVIPVPNYHTKVMVVFQTTTMPTAPVTFTLYKKLGENTIPLEALSTGQISKVTERLYTSILTIHSLSELDDYYLSCSHDDYSISPNYFIKIPKDAIVPEFSDKTASLFQILCKDNHVTGNEDCTQTLNIHPSTHHKITTDMFQNSDTYPNTVYLLYDNTSGKQYSMFYETNGFHKNIASKHLLCDYYQTGNSVKTTDDNYSASNLFYR